MQDFQKRIGHSGNFFLGEIWIFVEIIFFDPSEIGVLGLTWRKTMLFFVYVCAFVGEKSQVVRLSFFINVFFSFLICCCNSVQKRVKNIISKY